MLLAAARTLGQSTLGAVWRFLLPDRSSIPDNVPSRRDVLARAWEQVRANRGAAGIGGQTIAEVETYGVARMLDELRMQVETHRYRPQPVRRMVRRPARRATKDGHPIRPPCRLTDAVARWIRANL